MIEKEFIEELNNLGIEVNSTQLEQLNKYYEMLVEKNKVINLTRIIEKKDVYLKHFYDSLTIVKVIDLNQSLELCDVGTGAGFPGLVLKIMFPSLKITLIDSLQKRINFLDEVIKELDLKDIETIHARSEEYAHITNKKYDIVVSRAVANFNKLLPITIPLLKKDGLFIAMKANVEEELKESASSFKKMNLEIKRIEKFLLIKENSNRTLVVINKK